MRILQLPLAAAMVVLLAACDQKNNGQQPASVQSGVAAPEFPAAPAPPAEPIVSTIQVILMLDCISADGTSLTAPPARFLTFITLSGSDGRTIRFQSGVNDKLDLSAGADGHYILKLNLTPENPGDVIGQSVSALNAMSGLSFQFDALLANALHLSLGSGGVTRFAVIVNAITVVDTPLGAPSSAPGDNSPTQFDVSSQFGAAERVYHAAGGN